MTPSDPSNQVGQAHTDPRPAAVSFVTTEHFTLQGARSSTIAEATGRASMFLGAVSGGLVALGLVASAAGVGVGAAFYAFGLILLPTLAFVGLVTFDRALQAGILLSVPPAQRLSIQGLKGGRWQGFLTVAGMVSVVTAVLAGSAGGLPAAVVSGHALVPALVAGVLVAVAVLVWLLRHQAAAWDRVSRTPLFADEEAGPPRAAPESYAACLPRRAPRRAADHVRHRRRAAAGGVRA